MQHEDAMVREGVPVREGVTARMGAELRQCPARAMVMQTVRKRTRGYCAFLARRMSSSMRSLKPGCEARSTGAADRSTASGDGGPIGSGERAGYEISSSGARTVLAVAGASIRPSIRADCVTAARPSIGVPSIRCTPFMLVMAVDGRLE